MIPTEGVDMPRIGRLHIAGGCYHVMGRGLERRLIFAHDEDRQDFIVRLETGLARTGVACLAWAMMPNHYHLLLRVATCPLGGLMQNLLGGYAASYNRRHDRVGYVFQNRFKSILCQEETYLLELVRYIHLNPVRAGMVDDLTALDRYRWTGHAALMGKREQSWQQTGAVLARFGRSIPTARRGYREFIAQGLEQRQGVDYSGGGLIRSYGGWEALVHARRDHERRIGDERILGDSAFVARALEHDSLEIEASTRHLRNGWELSGLVQAVCQHFDLAEDRITDKGRQNTVADAKAVICYLGTTKLDLSSSPIAKRLKMSQAAVSESVKRGRAFCAEHTLGIGRLLKARR